MTFVKIFHGIAFDKIQENINAQCALSDYRIINIKQ